MPISGTTSAAHLDENLAAIDVSYSASELRDLSAAVSQVVIQGQRLRPGSLELSGQEAPLPAGS